MLLVRLAGLPDTSALFASLRGEPRGWGADRHLLATLVDAIQNNTYATIAVASKRKTRKPKPITRPRTKKKVAAVSAASFAGRGDKDGRTGR